MRRETAGRRETKDLRGSPVPRGLRVKWVRAERPGLKEFRESPERRVRWDRRVSLERMGRMGWG